MNTEKTQQNVNCNNGCSEFNKSDIDQLLWAELSQFVIILAEILSFRENRISV